MKSNLKYKEAGEADRRFMRRAIALSDMSTATGGGPFGAVITRGDEIISEGENRVTVSCDPTAHAEINAIRRAAQTLGTFDLSGCHIYTSCEPCPMCLAAIYWAHIDRIYYGNTRREAADAGFDDDFLYREFAVDIDRRSKPMERLLGDEAITTFEHWKDKEDKVAY